jgi:hypothetical protein
MEYRSTSSKEVIGRIIRNTRVNDSSYITDMPEWIAEAMGMMRTKYRLVDTYKDLLVVFHKARMPVGLAKINAVQYGANRLRSNARGALPQYDATISTRISMTTTTSLPYATQYDPPKELEGTEPINFGGIFVPYHDLGLCGNDWYFTELDHINTSFSNGLIRLHYKTIPLGEDGYPLILDNEHYKSAIYWYVRAMMGGAGYPDRQFTINQCEDRWLKHKRIAKGEINALSVDRTEEMVQNLTRLIIPATYMSDCL